MPRVLLPIADGCEELEAVTIIDLLRRADIEVVVAGLHDSWVTASRGTILRPDTTLEAVLNENFDLIVLPGGLPGTDHLDQDPRIHSILKRLHATGAYIAAICAAPRVLAHAGLLNGRTATSYPGCLSVFPQIQLSTNAVVIDGKMITSRGPGTALEFALTLIETLSGKEQRQAVEMALVCG